MTEKISIRDLTIQLEQGDSHNVTPFFQGKFEEERFKDLDAIRQLNQQDRTEGKTGVTLDCQKGFYYNTNISITSHDGSLRDWNGGRLLYGDALNMRSLKHSDASDLVPAVREPVDIRKLTDAAEAGDGNAVAKALNGKYAEERAAILEQTEALNKADLAAHKTEATLDITIGGSKGAANGMSVARRLPGAHDYWMNGTEIYWESLHSETGERDVQSIVDKRT